MRITKLLIFCLGWTFLFNQCGSDQSKKKEAQVTKNPPIKIEENIGSQKKSVSDNNGNKEENEKKSIVLNDQNAIPFFFEYQKENKEEKVRISTRFGNIDILLFKNTPYHRANFIYLTKKGYFNNTTFHRVVPGFIIQGGNSDRYETAKNRGEIG